MKTKTEEIQRIELTMEDLEGLLDRAKAVLAEKDYEVLENLVKNFVYMTQLLENQGITIKQLRKLFLGFKSEKLSKVLENFEEEKPAPGGSSSSEGKTAGGEEAGGGSASPGEERKDTGEGASEKKRGGHGRKPAGAYEGAEKVSVAHETLKPGDPCPVPQCKGKVYELPQPGVLVRIVGRAPLGATVIELQKLRCNLCLTVFTAKEPEGLGKEKYDETAASMMALLRYGTGVPFNRLEGLQGSFKIPLAASTQWDVVEKAYKKIAPAFDELIRQAAQGDVFHNDDTPMKILELMKKKKKNKEQKSEDG